MVPVRPAGFREGVIPSVSHIPPDRSVIRLASYNIRKAIGTDRQRRPDRILAVLSELDADVIALQEADRRLGARQSALPFESIAQHTPYRAVPYDVRPGGIGWHGNTILVRRDVDILDYRILELPVLEPRGAVMADLKVRGVPLRVVGMHLDLSGLWRRKQARAIIGHVEDSPRSAPGRADGGSQRVEPRRRLSARISATIATSRRPARASTPAARSPGSTASWQHRISR